MQWLLDRAARHDLWRSYIQFHCVSCKPSLWAVSVWPADWQQWERAPFAPDLSPLLVCLFEMGSLVRATDGRPFSSTRVCRPRLAKAAVSNDAPRSCIPPEERHLEKLAEKKLALQLCSP